MVVKSKHELGIGNLKLVERRRGCGDIPKPLVLLVAIFFFLVMSCFVSNKQIFSSP
jgi:hypothetical protein